MLTTSNPTFSKPMIARIEAEAIVDPDTARTEEQYAQKEANLLLCAAHDAGFQYDELTAAKMAKIVTASHIVRPSHLVELHGLGAYQALDALLAFAHRGFVTFNVWSSVDLDTPFRTISEMRTVMNFVCRESASPRAHHFPGAANPAFQAPKAVLAH